MSNEPFVPATPTRAFGDLVLGEKRISRERTISEAEILDFARAYDPQWFHTDADLAKQSVFGEVVASGIHVLAIWRQLDHEINWDIDWVCGIGWDNLRLHNATRAGDTLHVTSEIIELTPSKSSADRGTAITHYEVLKSTGQKAVTFTSINLVYTREGRAKRGQ